MSRRYIPSLTSQSGSASTGRRGQKEWNIATQLLAELSMEDYLQLAMMADASDEAYVLTLFADREAADLSLQANEVGAFIQHIDYLFLQGGCAHVEGYTQLAMKKLQQVRILNTGICQAARRAFARRPSIVVL